jgi:2-oxoglutarate dehydrogenase E1 component
MLLSLNLTLAINFVILKRGFNVAQYATRDNAEYIDSLYQQFRENPNSVSLEWRKFFEGVDFASNSSVGLSEKELEVYNLIEAYRNFGHTEADIDPLVNTTTPSDLLKLSKFNLSEKDLSSRFQIAKIIGKPNATLQEIITHLRACYCGKLTVQFADATPDIRTWFIREFEQKKDSWKLSSDEKKSIYKNLTYAEALEKFIHSRYVGAKRFSVEGGDAVVPMMQRMIDLLPELGGEEVMLGMAHRGRLNILTTIMGKSIESIFSEFNGNTELEFPLDDYEGDVKYHIGHSAEVTVKGGKKVKMTMAFNPSHLETVNPVILGMARAVQRLKNDIEKRSKVIPVLIHGDSAFAGQGIGQETFQMSQVAGYRVGGTIHIAIDNQVGFTTNPESARTSLYCSDVAKMVNTPVMHVNGDDAESAVRAIEIATRFRQEWSRDVVVVLTCYRRYGHNEGDEPAYTQPLMYDIIKKHATPRDLYAKKLAGEGVVTATAVEADYNQRMEELQKIYEATKINNPKIETFKFEGPWKGLRKARPEDFDKAWETGASMDHLKQVGQILSEPPTGFNPHPKLLKLLESRKNVTAGVENMDWGLAELFAYGTLLKEGFSVRLSGQDCIRGTFTHRHSALFDVKTGEPWFPLKSITPDKTHFCVYNSILSEYGVMGFEYGSSITDPQFLTMWEAQFGDFANGAQIIIDQYLVSGESKWQLQSGLVLLLPHGLEGQGPEHSSARFERFLQMCAMHNIQVMNMTTPAQVYHALRRQMKRPFRKPLVVMSPKSILRHPKATSNISELATGSFQEVIGDSINAKNVDTLILCTGKIYYDLLEEREKLGNQRTALVRVEQIYPTPLKKIAAQIKLYPNLKNLVWAQEEPKNMGAYQFLYFKLSEMLQKEGLNKLAFHYVGRGERSSPAVGSLYRHKNEQTEIIKNAFTI